jgi:protein phosphatase slingshot
MRIELADEPESQLIDHWDATYAFVEEARQSGHKLLVHCKMGVSRSASTVMAYIMKQQE